MVQVNWSELFPTRWSILIFTLYIVLFVSQGVLVTASQEANSKYNYDVVSVVLLTEVLKLVASVALYCKEHSLPSLVVETSQNKRILGLYLIPSFLYCLYNNLSFVNLSAFDPTTYYLLLQLRVVITAVLFQIIFKKKLNNKQWSSLLILTIGCMLKQASFTKLLTSDDGIASETGKSFGFTMDVHAVLILVQAICSCLAGVYNEYLLKEPGANLNIFVQNVFMYLDSILCNLVLLLFQSNSNLSFNNLHKLLTFSVIIIMINNAAIGIITSFFLKSMNSILKTFASALELVFTAILCYILFGIPIYLNTVLSICLVLFAIFLYSQSPVVNLPNISHKPKDHSEKELLIEEV